MVGWLFVSVLAHVARAEAADREASSSFVTLSVAVLRDAGSIHQVAADGAAGLCTSVAQSLHCPANGPVTFRWGGDDEFVLVGDTVLPPGGIGVAVVWAADDAREAEIARLAGPIGPDVVRDLFVRTGDPVVTPSPAMWSSLLALVDSPDARVRLEVVDALVPYWRQTASDPFPAGAPQVVPPEVIRRLAVDPSRAVRRRLASRLREVRAPDQPFETVANTVLLTLAATDSGGVQRAAFAALADRSRRGETPALEAWHLALDRVSIPGPPGRAAANTLAALATELEPSAEVDPRLALDRTAVHHLERVWHVWKAWRGEVPFDGLLAERLLRETVGVSPVLFGAWAQQDPEGLAELLRRWEPRSPHSDRYLYLLSTLRSPPPALQPLVDDTLSPETHRPAPW